MQIDTSLLPQKIIYKNEKGGNVNETKKIATPSLKKKIIH